MDDHEIEIVAQMYEADDFQLSPQEDQLKAIDLVKNLVDGLGMNTLPMSKALNQVKLDSKRRTKRRDDLA